MGIDLDLTNPTNASQLTCVRSTVGYHDNLSGNWTSFAVDTPRITDRGLRVEPARTNGIRNNSMQGAVISPATLPTNWVVSGAFACAYQVVETGVENGVEYIDLRFYGANAGGGGMWISFDGPTQIVSANGQTWVSSAFVKIVAGDATKFNNPPLYIGWSVNTVAGAYISEPGSGGAIPMTVGGPLTRVTRVGTIADATGVRVQPFIYGEYGAVSGSGDVTVRIGWPQMELVDATIGQNSIATSPIRTTSVAVTRSADDITVANFSSWFTAGGPGTILLEGKSGAYPAPQGSAPGYLEGASGSFGGFIYDVAYYYQIYNGGVSQAEATVSSVFLPQYKLALAWASNDAQAYANGIAGPHDTVNTIPTYTMMRLGKSPASVNYFGTDGPITRFAYWPSRMGDAYLRSLTSVGGKTIDLDLTNSATAGQLTCTRASVGYHDDLDGVWTSFAVNTPRITNRGLRVEETRTNGIRNNSMQGAVISPATLPTHWATGFVSGATYQVVGTGVEKGVDYIDVRIFGTGPIGLELDFEAGNVIAASNTQVWIGSAFVRLISGDVSTMGWFYLGWSVNNSSGTWMDDAGDTTSLPRNFRPLTRIVSKGTIANASTAYVQPYLYMEGGSGALDFTIRIGWPQLELCSPYYDVTSPIRTTGTAVTRAAEDVTVNNLSAWYTSGPGTILFEGKSNQYKTVGAATPGYITNGTQAIEFIYDSATAIIEYMPGIERAVGGITLAAGYKFAVGWAVNDVQLYAHGQPAYNSFSNAVYTYTAMHLGTGDLGYTGTDGPITRFAYWNKRLDDATLKTLTTMGPTSTNLVKRMT